jgi:AcrR family transcriptional regulator
MATASVRRGLRERKKLRTRETIVRVGLDLFARRGYQATTLAQIADEAEIAPSTLYTYFPSKEDIVFSIHDAVRESVSRRIVHRPESETVVEAMVAWIESELSPLAATDTETTVRQRRAAIDGDDTLVAAERLRHALLEDDFALAFARDLGESPDDLRSRLMASLVTNGLLTVWTWWYRGADGAHDPHELSQLDATYLMRIIEAGEGALKAIPSPPPHARGVRVHDEPSLAECGP